MPQSTTRAGRWRERKRKYARKMLRVRNSYPSHYDKPGHAGFVDRPNGPISFVGQGNKQQPLYSLYVDPINGAPWSILTPPFTISSVNYRRPPHINVGGVSPEINHGHPIGVSLGFHNRSVSYMGRKTHKMHGNERAIWYATLSARLYRLDLDVGINMFPPWDPLGRTPVSEVAYWDQ